MGKFFDCFHIRATTNPQSTLYDGLLKFLTKTNLVLLYLVSIKFATVYPICHEMLKHEKIF